MKSLVFPTDIRTVNYDDALDVRTKGCAGFLSEAAKLLIWLDNLRATSEVRRDLSVVKEYPKDPNSPLWVILINFSAQ